VHNVKKLQFIHNVIYVCIDFQDLLAKNGGFGGKIGEVSATLT